MTSMMPSRQIRTNQVLLRLRPADRTLVERHLNPVELAPGAVLYEQGEPISTVYFPLCGQVSLVVVAADGRETESAAIGNEGVVGLGGCISGGTSFTHQRVQLPGAAMRIARDPFVEALEFSSTLRGALAAHYDAFAAQLLQSAFCLGNHQALERVARWLLTAYDTVEEDGLALTQDTVARALGLTRPTITLALNHASAAGVLRVERGRLVLLNRRGLESLACSCYSIIRANFNRSDVSQSTE